MSLAAPTDGGSLAAAAHWLEALVQGPLAVTLAVLAVAATGLMMLAGRLPLRRGLAVTIGCFILFGAPAIARGIMNSATVLSGSEGAAPPQPATAQPLPPPPPPPRPAVSDPYAGASLAQ